MSKVKISKSMLDQLEYDKDITLKAAKEDTMAAKDLITPTVMIVFAGADLNAASYHLVKSLETPFAANAIATLLVQESIHDHFIELLKFKLKTPTSGVTAHTGYVKALENIKRLKLKGIVAEGSENYPSLVCDATHEQLGTVATGIVTLHTFRTAKEAIQLCAKESITFDNVSIWNENHSCAYELVVGLNNKNFFINCFQVSMEPFVVAGNGKSFAAVHKNYHYETLQHGETVKNVVFPIGTIFAN